MFKSENLLPFSASLSGKLKKKMSGVDIGKSPNIFLADFDGNYVDLRFFKDH